MMVERGYSGLDRPIEQTRGNDCLCYRAAPAPNDILGLAIDYEPLEKDNLTSCLDLSTSGDLEKAKHRLRARAQSSGTDPGSSV